MIHNPELPLFEDVTDFGWPHNWLDGVIEAVPGVSGRGFWTPGPEHYQGHFRTRNRVGSGEKSRERQLLMGVKMAETLNQLGAYVLELGIGEEDLAVLLRGFKAYPSSPVLPGQTLESQIEVVDRRERKLRGFPIETFTARGVASVADRLTCRSDINGMIVPGEFADLLLDEAYAQQQVTA